VILSPHNAGQGSRDLHGDLDARNVLAGSEGKD
jgi:hypothetical protein